MKKQSKPFIGPRVILPPGKTLKEAMDYSRQAAKADLRKEVRDVR